jgi:hypothetical protein
MGVPGRSPPCLRPRVITDSKNCRSRPEVMVDFDDRGIVLR